MMDARVKHGHDNQNWMTTTYDVYIMASRKNGTLYIGVTNDLVRRVWQHKEGETGGFTTKYGVKQLVHFETFQDIGRARQREKNLKHWPRAWKIALIEKDNPRWTDLYDVIIA